MTPEQQEILDLIAKVWEKHPEYRFCQLLGIAFGENEDVDTYYIPDDTLGQLLRLTYCRDL